MPRIALGIEYDGTGFFGWQVQPYGRSVQSELEKALAKVANEPVAVVCAGRTDSGVHATGQVVHFDTAALREPHSWLLGGNTYLPRDVNLCWAREVPGDFHARFSATRRSYRYLILNRRHRSALWDRRATWSHGELDVEAMHHAAQHLLGEHDFSAFRAAGCQAKSPVRTVSNIRVRRIGALVELTVIANAFLQHMVRNIVGSLLAIGRGDADADWLLRILSGRDRRRAGMTAPPEGLYLTGVGYPPVYGLPDSIEQEIADCFIIEPLYGLETGQGSDELV